MPVHALVKAQVAQEQEVAKVRTADVLNRARTAALALTVRTSHSRIATITKVEDQLCKRRSRNSMLVQQQLSWMMQQQKLA
ncbi:hypothetical protein D3C86_1960390 [compost metagenome]